MGTKDQSEPTTTTTSSSSSSSRWRTSFRRKSSLLKKQQEQQQLSDQQKTNNNMTEDQKMLKKMEDGVNMKKEKKHVAGKALFDPEYKLVVNIGIVKLRRAIQKRRNSRRRRSQVVVSSAEDNKNDNAISKLKQNHSGGLAATSPKDKQKSPRGEGEALVGVGVHNGSSTASSQHSPTSSSSGTSTGIEDDTERGGGTMTKHEQEDDDGTDGQKNNKEQSEGGIDEQAFIEQLNRYVADYMDMKERGEEEYDVYDEDDQNVPLGLLPMDVGSPNSTTAKSRDPSLSSGGGSKISSHGTVEIESLPVSPHQRVTNDGTWTYSSGVKKERRLKQQGGHDEDDDESNHQRRNSSYASGEKKTRNPTIRSKKNNNYPSQTKQHAKQTKDTKKNTMALITNSDSCCDHPYQIKLFKTRGFCSVCVYHLSVEEKQRLETTGRSILVNETFGGCLDCHIFKNKSTTTITNKKNEDGEKGDGIKKTEVRLCRKCFFDTHKLHKKTDAPFRYVASMS